MSGVVVGIDVGTSGVRAVAIDADARVVAEGAARMSDHGTDHRDPRTWEAALAAALSALLGNIEPERIRALSVDGTSGTVLAVDASGRPVGAAMMYNDPVADAGVLERISSFAPPTSAAHGATSGLAKAILLQDTPGAARILHQADWIAGLLSGRFDVSDENNALKTGYDPVAGRWPGWIAGTGARTAMLPAVVAPGTPTGKVTAAAAERFGLPQGAVVAAGTTDGCASFLATGADRPGDGVTALGTTLTLKILSQEPVFAPQFGIYSHRLRGGWLAGGASNTGGKVLLDVFSPERLAALSAEIDPETDSCLDYYPLSRPGERFPVADPAFPPRLEPRPTDDALFLKGLFEGIAAVEALAYARLAELGAPPLASLRSVGGGAANPVWTRIRERRLKVPFLPAASTEAAAGTARLALDGARAAGVMP